MKRIILHIIIMTLPLNVFSQLECYYTLGDTLTVNNDSLQYKDTVSIYLEPSPAAEIIAKAGVLEKVVVASRYTENDFLKVNYRDLKNVFIKADFLSDEYGVYSPSFDPENKNYYQEKIDLMEYYKQNNLCKYKPWAYSVYILGMAKCLVNEKKFIEALPYLTKSITTDPNADNLSFRGYVKYELDDFRGAINDFDKAIKLYEAVNVADYWLNEFSQLYYYRGYCKYSLKNAEDAIKDFNKALKLNPENSYAYLNRGSCKLLLNDIDEACKDFSKAGELGLNIAFEKIRENCNK